MEHLDYKQPPQNNFPDLIGIAIRELHPVGQKAKTWNHKGLHVQMRSNWTLTPNGLRFFLDSVKLPLKYILHTARNPATKKDSVKSTTKTRRGKKAPRSMHVVTSDDEYEEEVAEAGERHLFMLAEW